MLLVDICKVCMKDFCTVTGLCLDVIWFSTVTVCFNVDLSVSVYVRVHFYFYRILCSAAFWSDEQ